MASGYERIGRRRWERRAAGLELGSPGPAVGPQLAHPGEAPQGYSPGRARTTTAFRSV